MKMASHAIPRFERRSYHNRNGDMVQYCRAAQADDLRSHLAEIDKMLVLAIKRGLVSKVLRLTEKRNKTFLRLQKRISRNVRQSVS